MLKKLRSGLQECHALPTCPSEFRSADRTSAKRKPTSRAGHREAPRLLLQHVPVLVAVMAFRDTQLDVLHSFYRA